MTRDTISHLESLFAQIESAARTLEVPLNELARDGLIEWRNTTYVDAICRAIASLRENVAYAIAA